MNGERYGSYIQKAENQQNPPTNAEKKASKAAALRERNVMCTHTEECGVHSYRGLPFITSQVWELHFGEGMGGIRRALINQQERRVGLGEAGLRVSFGMARCVALLVRGRGVQNGE